MNAIVPLENISSGSEDSSEESSEEVRESTRDSVLRLLRKDNKRTAKDLSSLIGVTDRAIEKHLAKL